MSALTASSSNGSDNSELPAPDTPLLDRLTALAPEIDSELARLDKWRDDEMQRHQAALAEIDKQRKRLAQFRRIAADEPATKPQRKMGSRRGEASGRVIVQLIEGIERQEGLFTALGVHEAVGATWSEPHTYTTFAHLHDLKYIGKVRKDADSKRTLYRVLEPELGERLKREFGGEPTETPNAA